MIRKALTLIVVASALSGCVMASTHEALIKKYDAKVAENQALQKALATANAGVTELTTERDALASALKQLQAEKAKTLKDNTQLTASIQQMQTALAELDARKRQAEARVAEFRALIDRFKPLIDTGKLTVRLEGGRMKVVLATDVLFASGKADLSDEGVEAITEVGVLLAGIEGRRYQVEGHTDDVQIKSRRFPSNWELGAARALTVVKTMVEAGLGAERISGASYGEFSPAASNDSDEGKAANRRIEIVLVPDLSTLPGFDELKQLEKPAG